MIAPAFLISWNLTRRCNLHCAHCYLGAEQSDAGRGDLSTDQALQIVEKISAYCPGAMLILTGGEPLLREDLWQIATAATKHGLVPVLGTNGALINANVVTQIKAAGIQGVGISLDSIHPDSHDRFRGQPGAWAKTMAGVDEMVRQGVEFQLQFTVTKNNYSEIPQLIELARQKGAKAANVFFLVCTGRGQKMTDISAEQYEKMLTYLVQAEDTFAGEIMVRARCAPHFLRIAAEENPDASIMRGMTSGCIAGSGYFRITPEGDVTPCPYIPETVGNLLTEPLSLLWEDDTMMRSLRQPVYNGKCAACSYQEVCGGCRARALSAEGDLMGEDPWCSYQPDQPSTEKKALGIPVHKKPLWEHAAKERLSLVPFFLRTMVKMGVERYARNKGLDHITPELMMEMRSRVCSKK